MIFFLIFFFEGGSEINSKANQFTNEIQMKQVRSQRNSLSSLGERKPEETPTADETSTKTLKGNIQKGDVRLFLPSFMVCNLFSNFFHLMFLIIGVKAFVLLQVLFVFWLLCLLVHYCLAVFLSVFSWVSAMFCENVSANFIWLF